MKPAWFHNVFCASSCLKTMLLVSFDKHCKVKPGFDEQPGSCQLALGQAFHGYLDLLMPPLHFCLPTPPSPNINTESNDSLLQKPLCYRLCYTLESLHRSYVQLSHSLLSLQNQASAFSVICLQAETPESVLGSSGGFSPCWPDQ